VESNLIFSLVQGGEIMDAALCGGGVPNQGVTDTSVRLSSSAVNMVKAAIFMGDPLFRAGLPYDVGTCGAGGVFITLSFLFRFWS
jgi:acetylxylan esterase